MGLIRAAGENVRAVGGKKHCSGKLKSMTLTGVLSHICFIGADVFAGKKVNPLAKPPPSHAPPPPLPLEGEISYGHEMLDLSLLAGKLCMNLAKLISC